MQDKEMIRSARKSRIKLFMAYGFRQRITHATAPLYQLTTESLCDALSEPQARIMLKAWVKETEVKLQQAKQALQQVPDGK